MCFIEYVHAKYIINTLTVFHQFRHIKLGIMIFIKKNCQLFEILFLRIKFNLFLKNIKLNRIAMIYDTSIA